ncbi:hypothetical protein PC119_g6575 [Phytophthora cactorum]|nr:hypothetical protein PC119_g6575 [Phytophthora cactorum]
MLSSCAGSLADVAPHSGGSRSAFIKLTANHPVPYCLPPIGGVLCPKLALTLGMSALAQNESTMSLGAG